MRPPRFDFIERHPNPTFWSSFFVLNLLLFLPAYALDAETSTLLPAITGGDFWPVVESIFVWRNNLDPLRLSLELTLIGALWVTVRQVRRRVVMVAVTVLYLLAFAYAIYEAIVMSIFLVDPNFYSQYFWAGDGLPFLAEHLQTSWWLYATGLLGILAGAGLLVLLVNTWLKSGAAPRIHPATRVVMFVLVGYVAFTAFRYQIYTALPEMVVSSLGFKLQKNVAASLDLYQDVISFDDATVRAAYDYDGYRLTRTPDIYLIFVESYGSVLYKRPDYLRQYTALVDELHTQLADAGWHATTTLSESPTWGGGSWLAYTSTLFGLRIDNHPQYLSLLNKYQVDTYPGLGRALHDQGYHYVWLSALSENLTERTWARYLRLSGADELIRNQDLDYAGPLYGWGPAPPDQYVLNHVRDMLAQRVHQPLLLFTITQNSHFPWLPLPELVDDWRTLNQSQAATAPVDPDAIAHATERQNYMDAIDYQLRMLTDFILSQDNDNALFVLVGDHQPPRVSRRADGWETPIHIVSKDAELIAAFAEYGFSPGLKAESVRATLHHEGIYSMLMRVLLDQYGIDHLHLPAYLPLGVASGPSDGAVSQEIGEITP